MSCDEFLSKSSWNNNNDSERHVENNEHASTINKYVQNAASSEVQLRQKSVQSSQEKSATHRKRRSRNLLSNRRGTGPITPEELEAAAALGEKGIQNQ